MAKLLYLDNKHLACNMCIFHSYFYIPVLYFSLRIREFFSYFFMPESLAHALLPQTVNPLMYRLIAAQKEVNYETFNATARFLG